MFPVLNQNRIDYYNYICFRNETSNPNDLSDLLSASSIGPPDILSNLDQHGATGGGAFANGPLWSAKGWKPPILTPLPPDFLRVKKLKQGHAYTHPNHRPEHHSPFNQEMLRERMSENEKKLGSLTSHSDLADLQMLEDEKFALMLQNEEFMAELRVNDEFLSALHEDHESGQPIEFSSKKSHGHGHHMDDAAFKEKLKNMGKTSKQKFAKLAMMFRQRGGNRLLGHAPAPSKDNLLLDAENYVEQQDSDSEEEKHSTTKVNKFMLTFQVHLN